MRRLGVLRRCRVGWVALALCLGCGDDPRPNLLLISIDTLRADRIGAYGYERETTPTLDALAARGVRFETVIAESSWTLPSHVTLFTGLPPSFHGVVRPNQGLAETIPTLAEILRQYGYRTSGITGGVFLEERFGVARGFDQYRDDGVDFSTALRIVLRILERPPRAGPFFWFIHTYDVHCPYHPPARYARMFDSRPPRDRLDTRGRCGNPHYNRMPLRPGQVAFLSDRYDAGIRYADDLLGDFLAKLDASGRLDHTIVAVVSDHGDEFLEHGRIGHRNTLFIESLRIPWILAGPGIEPGVVTEPVGLADVMPTLLDLLGLPVPDLEGRSMRAVMRGEARRNGERPVFSENQWGEELYSAVFGDHHLIVRRQTQQVQLFDWRRDPRESRDLLGERPARDETLRRLLSERIGRLDAARNRNAPEIAPGPSDPEQARLRALGYVEVEP